MGCMIPDENDGIGGVVYRICVFRLPSQLPLPFSLYNIKLYAVARL